MNASLERPPDSCRVCAATMRHTLVDLGMIPLCQSYTESRHLVRGETFYPLHANVCMECQYVGVPEYVTAQEIFTEYAYFSSVSESWVQYVRDSANSLIHEFGLDATSLVVEMASNDGYFLQFFAQRGVPVIGVEPAANVAKVANDKGIFTLPKFFNSETAGDLRVAGKAADLLLAYNSLDHVPDLNDVLRGMKLLLQARGVIQIEVPYLRSLVDGKQFDTVYHDRFSYFSLLPLHRAFACNGLRVFDVVRIPTHGGSLRLRACHADNSARPDLPSVAALLAEEEACGLKSAEYYADFMQQVVATKHDLLAFLVGLKRDGKSIVGYGVAAKANVFLNYCGVRNDFLDYLVDRSPYKVGKYAPGTRLPILDVDQIRVTRPDYVLILPWNIKDEIVRQVSYIREWGGKFVVAIPEVQVL
jgi:SAM-dependent methyltransferase